MVTWGAGDPYSLRWRGEGTNLPQGYSPSPPGNGVCVCVGHSYLRAAPRSPRGPQIPHGCLHGGPEARVSPRIPPDAKLPQACPTDPSGPEITSGLPHRPLRIQKLPQVCPTDPPRPTVTSGLPPRFPGVTPTISPGGFTVTSKLPPAAVQLHPTPPPPPAHSPAAAGRGPHGAAGGPAPAGPAATQRACAETPAAAQARPTPLQRAQARCR